MMLQRLAPILFLTMAFSFSGLALSVDSKSSKKAETSEAKNKGSAKRKVAGTNCSFSLRTESDYLYRLMPVEVEGWIQCAAGEEGSIDSLPNQMFVAKLKHTTGSTELGISRAKLLSWFSAFESLIVPGAHQTKTMNFQTEERGQKFAEVDSIRSTETMSHIIFTAVSPLNRNESIVFIYSDSLERMKLQRKNIAQMRKEFTSPANLKVLAQNMNLP